MASRALYPLISLAEFVDTMTTELIGAWFPIGQRTKWDFHSHVVSLSGGGSVDLSIQVSPTGTDDHIRDVFAFTQVTTSPIDELKTSYHEDTSWAISKYDQYVRAKITAIVGTAVLQVDGVAPAFGIGPPVNGIKIGVEQVHHD